MDDRFVEIDYGPDENQPESVVIERIGEDALIAWNELGKVPPGWHVDVQQLKTTWLRFFEDMHKQRPGQKILVVTSNGTARFAPAVLEQPSPAITSLKMKTGYMSLFEASSTGSWYCSFWDKKP